ncbi:alpha/beta-hydrolase [Tothia fuscella]|uniref:Carboxylic ester hydrolase n=1 Tax=Tothia fuscella TaxID=1048955 RepID=A0A9P4U5D5_9PEZI|nr:alpha/beta-hydrolase [Tothia fuscella]
MKFLALSALIFLRWTIAAPLQTNSTNPIIDLGIGVYKGLHNSSTRVNIFYGIRYAPAPKGDLRWRPPQNDEEVRYISRGEIIDATKPGPKCIQGTPAWQQETLVHTKERNALASEDCLLLDISTPSNILPGTTLPVIVQIHGGGFTLGGVETRPAQALMRRANNSLIYVSIQYRLGALGFLSSKALRADGSANVGLLDQRAALTWVQSHISGFGGDPDRVTIFGGSAGGGSVTAQMMLYGGSPGLDKPPFSAAIAEYPWWQPFHADAILEAQYEQLLQAAGCADLACLRNISEPALASAAQKTFELGYNRNAPLYGYGDYCYGPSVDGDIIRDLPSREFKRGAFSSVPLLINRDAFEGVSFSNKSEVTLEQEMTGLRSLFPNADEKFFAALFDLYPVAEFNSTLWHRQTLFGDFIINCPTQWIADAVVLLGKPVYKMVFEAGDGQHGATSPFLFDGSPLCEL